ncbi:hypothetical protein Z045_24805 [Rhodococcus pyridinivorans KG-16]|uniref:Uncharacterized protein n=1 Tax=Rhodococcus pyridinivorans KG-16 TaxID=1441730 RepID=A0A0V9UE80_9NOCA|nr:hypothetical protein Z045_24805 [Rhodococcus pyridinivorans KG-16]
MVRTLTVDEAREELASLLKNAGMSREELEERGEQWELDASQRGVLADIRSLEFLIGRATRR